MGRCTYEYMGFSSAVLPSGAVVGREAVGGGLLLAEFLLRVLIAYARIPAAPTTRSTATTEMPIIAPVLNPRKKITPLTLTVIQC